MTELEQLLRSFSSKRRTVSLTDVNRCSYEDDGDSASIEGAPIHIAADKNDLAGMRVLLDNGADVNLRSGGGCGYETALHVAAEAGNHKMLQLLLERGADVNAMDHRYETPLHNAANRECILALVAAGAWVDGGAVDDADTPLHEAVGWSKWSPDRVRGMSGNLERIRTLLEVGANVNALANRNGTPLHYFLERAKPEFSRRDELFMLTLSLLLQHGADVNARQAGYGNTPLHIAVEKGLDVRTLDKLLEHGAYVNASDSHGCTPLHGAVEEDRYEHAERLLQAGADASIADVNGNTVGGIAKGKGKGKAKAKILRLLSDYNSGS